MPVLQGFQDFHPLSKTSITTLGAVFAMLTAFAESVGEEKKIGAMFIILFVSLFAVSFPSLSQQISFLRIPAILFFIGKHFGTGVILATAFIHLLDDAFRSLQDQKVEDKYGKVGKWTGSIILASLLSIFLVEYISTTYVQRLQEKPSAPPTPLASRPNSHLSSPINRSSSRSRRTTRKVSSPSRSRSKSVLGPHKFPPRPTADSPLIPDLDSPPNVTFTRAPSAPVIPVQAHAHLNVPHHVHSTHHHHHSHGPTIPASAVVGLPIEVLTNSPRICRLALAHDHVHGHHHHHIWEGDGDGARQPGEGEASEDVGRVIQEAELEHEREHESHHHTIGRRRQVVGLLVLQLGIMIHSLVIGLTLSVTSGSDFTSLTTAIIFHQLFEGLSLGIRIAALPPNRNLKKTHITELGQKDSNIVNGLNSVSPQSTTALPDRRFHDNEGSSPGSSSTQQSPSPLLGDNHPVASHGNAIFSKSSRLSGADLFRRCVWKMKEFEWLKPTLTFLFGVTTPFGMGIGMAVWSRRANDDPGEEGSMLLIQGVMSAISAGLLIYAATVEMIAADFVFGDVEGNHHHHHAHAHAHTLPESDDEERGGDHREHRMDEERGDEVNDGRTRASLDETGKRKEPTAVRKQVLAVLSLFAGAGTMVLVGLGE